MIKSQISFTYSKNNGFWKPRVEITSSSSCDRAVSAVILGSKVIPWDNHIPIPV